MDDIIVKDTFFDLHTVKKVFDYCQTLTHGEDFIDQKGIFNGQLIAHQTSLGISGIHELTQILDKTLELFNYSAKIVTVSYTRLYLPWDIHTDLISADSYNPFYNVLIPLTDADSSTVVFNQWSTEYNEFYKYKQSHPQESNPIDLDTWNQNLSMCWSEDRLWLTIKQILPKQRAGQIVAFKRKFFHSSDQFHLRQNDPKHFLQVILDKKH